MKRIKQSGDRTQPCQLSNHALAAVSGGTSKGLASAINAVIKIVRTAVGAGDDTAGGELTGNPYDDLPDGVTDGNGDRPGYY